jgi:glycosyltransferase involved in cell wall biosynthesis
MAEPAQLPASGTSGLPLRMTLCLLTWNELEGCRHDVPNLPLDQFDEVYAVDGGSKDGTVEYLRARGITVYEQPKRGYNQAYLCAFGLCTTDALVLFHPKGSVDPREVAKFRPLFEQGYDLVIASHLIRGARNEEDDKLFRPRKWFVLWLGCLSGLVWRRKGPIIFDVLHGFRGMRRDRFGEINLLENGLSADLEMVIRGYRRRYRMKEIPVHEKTRLAGTTHFKAFKTARQLIAYLWQELRRPL